MGHLLRCPIRLLHDPTHDLPFTIDEEGVGAIPDPVGIGGCTLLINEDRGDYVEIFFVFQEVFFFLFRRHFEKNQVRVLELLMKDSKRGRLPLAVRSP